LRRGSSFVFFIYAFLHEAGHAIAGFLFGQSLTEFNVNFWDFSAHVAMVGGELTQFQRMVQSAAGAGMPLLLWAIFMSAVPRKSNTLLELLKLISSMGVVNTLLAWMVLPILFVFGKAPSDDVINFLRYSQTPPILLILMAAVLYSGGWILFLSKIDGLQNEFSLFNMTDRERLLVGTRKTVSIMTGVMVACLIFVATLDLVASGNSLSRFSPPQDFESVAQIDLSIQAYQAETLTEFKLEAPTYVGIFVSIHNINTTYFDLSVTGPNQFSSVVLHGEGYNAFQDGGLWEKNLSPGSYQVVLTSHQNPGTVSVYMKTR
jgi:peptidase M50B-like protein